MNTVLARRVLARVEACPDVLDMLSFARFHRKRLVSACLAGHVLLMSGYWPAAGGVLWEAPDGSYLPDALRTAADLIGTGDLALFSQDLDRDTAIARFRAAIEAAEAAAGGPAR